MVISIFYALLSTRLSSGIFGMSGMEEFSGILPYLSTFLDLILFMLFTDVKVLLALYV